MVGNGPIFLFLLTQFVLSDVAQEVIIFEPLGSCVYSQSLKIQSVNIISYKLGYKNF